MVSSVLMETPAREPAGRGVFALARDHAQPDELESQRRFALALALALPRARPCARLFLAPAEESRTRRLWQQVLCVLVGIHVVPTQLGHLVYLSQRSLVSQEVRVSFAQRARQNAAPSSETRRTYAFQKFARSA